MATRRFGERSVVGKGAMAVRETSALAAMALSVVRCERRRARGELLEVRLTSTFSLATHFLIQI
jgi:hypothetical protein